MTHLKALALARSGQLERAGALARRAIDLAEKARQPERAALFQAAPAVWHALMGNVAEARRTAALALDMSTGRDVSYAAAFALALTGDLSRSQALLKDLEARFPQDTTVNISYLPALRGLIALQQGKPAEALTELEPALANEFALPGHGILRQLWQPVSGLRARPDVSGRKKAGGRGRRVPEDHQPPRSRHGRSRRRGRAAAAGQSAALRAEITAGARAAYQDFLTLWKQADTDVPLLKQAQAEAAKLR